MNILQWDENEIVDFFEYSSITMRLEDEDAKTFQVNDDIIQAEIVILPKRRVICFTFRRVSGGILSDLSILANAPLCRRKVDGLDCLYCHESSVLPGINAYERLEWFQFYDYGATSDKAVSTLFRFRPAISLRFYDPDASNRALKFDP